MRLEIEKATDGGYIVTVADRCAARTTLHEAQECVRELLWETYGERTPAGELVLDFPRIAQPTLVASRE